MMTEPSAKEEAAVAAIQGDEEVASDWRKVVCHQKGKQLWYTVVGRFKNSRGD